MNLQQKYKRVFIIGPMNDMKRFNWLRDDVVKPVLEPLGFEVHSPEEGLGNVMQDVLLNLEQADILIADLSGWNPNVLYELGVYHSFGKPCLLVKDCKSSEKDAPFDIRAYRYGLLDFEDAAASRATIKPALEAILGDLDKKDWFSNPVTDFYESPVAEIPTAVGLSKNYVRNFLEQLLPAVFEPNAVVRIQNENGVKELLTAEDLKQLHFEIRIPEKLEFASHARIDALRDDASWELVPAQVERGSRPFNLFFYRDEAGRPVLADIPTVLNTLYDSIEKRRKPKGHREVASEEWKILESQELERFAAKCDLFKQQFEHNYPRFRDRLRLAWRWTPGTHNDIST